MQLIPAIDLRGGHCVRLLQGDFAIETRYSVSPESLYQRYADAGAGWLHVVDLDGARAGAPRQLPLIAALAARGQLKLQAGGGVREPQALAELRAAGVARVVIGSLAISDPARVAGWLGELGAEVLALALDVRLDAAGTPWVATHGWRAAGKLTLWEALELYREADLRHVLCTDVERDGAFAGPNLALYQEARRRHPQLEWQASGGVRDAADLAALAALGVAATISGRALLEERLPPAEYTPFLRGA